ncbi:hypothetical protein TrLO_g14066 [Triparma laevis f. longispina]|uniref:Uncharacterized protein n=1 Tax=Triparma laevis f. longispina TaxID=1714387 RepID=A0A9W7CA87_9STRA|nr:hypothetical protein TrLO_g14066 [Triparma laevis f. longispina]
MLSILSSGIKCLKTVTAVNVTRIQEILSITDFNYEKNNDTNYETSSQDYSYNVFTANDVVYGLEGKGGKPQDMEKIMKVGRKVGKVVREVFRKSLMQK